MQVYIQTAVGQELNAAVARSLGWIDNPDFLQEAGNSWYMSPHKQYGGVRISKSDWRPSENWAQGGKIIAKERISTFRFEDSEFNERWEAKIFNKNVHSMDCHQGDNMQGGTILVAAMRAFAYSKLGLSFDFVRTSYTIS